MLKPIFFILLSFTWLVSCGGSSGGVSPNTGIKFPDSGATGQGSTTLSLDPFLFFDICEQSGCVQSRVAQMTPSLISSVNLPLSDQYYRTKHDSNSIAHTQSKIFFVAQADMSGAFQLFEYDRAKAEVLPIDSDGLDPSELIAHDQKLYYSATTTAQGREVWVYDIQSKQSSMLLDINTGSESSTPRNFISINNKLYFTATDALHGEELRELDTSLTLGASNPRVADIFSGANSGLPSRMKLIGDKIYFSAFEITHGVETWVLDTTNMIDLASSSPNPQILVDLENGLTSTFPDNYSLANGKIYFTATTPATGDELWVYDPVTGATPSPVEVNSGPSTSGVTSLISVNNKLFFNADANSGTGEELWMYDPSLSVSATNPGLVYDIATGAGSSSPKMLAGFDGYLYFSAEDSLSGLELRLLNTNTLSAPEVYDYTSGTGSSEIKSFYLVDQ